VNKAMRILLATDGSLDSESALQALLSSPWPAGSRVRVLSVAPIASWWAVDLGIDVPRYDHLFETMANEAREIADRTADAVRSAGLQAEAVTRPGDPRVEIVEEAERWKADLVLLGSHGRTGLARLLVGSIAEHVVRHAPCSVQVARTRQHPSERT
jgi:nucleotide-binding universal stress UspA family protein